MFLSLTVAAAFLAADPAMTKPEPLWPKGAPSAKAGEPTNKPNLTIYPAPADKAVGTAVLVCPGGGYGALALGHEGKDVAAWLNERGITAGVLQYRIAEKGRPGPLHPAPLLDAQRGLRMLRARAKELGVQPNRIGVWGFSAGGHLASTLATHFDAGKADAEDPIDRVSSRPDFAILAYPVITMSASTHGGSKRNLIGAEPSAELVELYSNEKRVTKETPPTFLFHTVEDKAVPIENSKLFEAACKQHGVPVELVIYEKGKHGVGLAANDPELSKWTEKLAAWLKGRGVLTK